MVSPQAALRYVLKETRMSGLLCTLELSSHLCVNMDTTFFIADARTFPDFQSDGYTNLCFENYSRKHRKACP